MTGTSIKIDLHDETARARLQDVLDRLDNRRPLLAVLGERLARFASDNFRSEKGLTASPGSRFDPRPCALVNERSRPR